MPILEFRCRTCRCQYEELILKPAAALETACPRCGTADVERLFSVFGLRHRGADGNSSAGHSSAGCSSCTRNSCAGCGD